MAFGLVMIAAALAAPAAAEGRKERAVALSGNPAQFFGPDEYPPEAIRKGEQGRVIARLEVDGTGRVTDCNVTQSSGSTALDVRTCVIAVGRVRFTPAMDRAGKPIASRYMLPVRWVLPELTPEPRQTENNVITLRLAADNRVEGCAFEQNGVAIPAPANGCADWGEQKLGTFRDEVGPGRVTLKLQIIVRFEGTAAPVELRSLPGYKVLRLGRAKIDIRPDGTAANQQLVEQIGAAGPFNPIESLPRYAPAPKPTQVEVVTTLAYAKSP